MGPQALFSMACDFNLGGRKKIDYFFPPLLKEIIRKV